MVSSSRRDVSQSGWQLLVRHERGGPLGAFASELHRRDLAISFGVLFLLVALVAVLIVTSLRANRLAKLQMDFVTAISHELRSPLTSSGLPLKTSRMAWFAPENRSINMDASSRNRRGSSRVSWKKCCCCRNSRRPSSLQSPAAGSIRDRRCRTGRTADLVEAAKFSLERDIPANLPKVRAICLRYQQCLQNLITMH
jgi:hypothetical protein